MPARRERLFFLAGLRRAAFLLAVFLFATLRRAVFLFALLRLELFARFFFVAMMASGLVPLSTVIRPDRRTAGAGATGHHRLHRAHYYTSAPE